MAADGTVVPAGGAAAAVDGTAVLAGGAAVAADGIADQAGGIMIGDTTAVNGLLTVQPI